VFIGFYWVVKMNGLIIDVIIVGYCDFGKWMRLKLAKKGKMGGETPGS